MSILSNDKYKMIYRVTNKNHFFRRRYYSPKYLLNVMTFMIIYKNYNPTPNDFRSKKWKIFTVNTVLVNTSLTLMNYNT